MTDLLDTLTQELNQFTTAGQQSLNSLIDSTDTFLQQLRDMEAELACELEIETKENHNAVNLQNEQDSDDTFHFQQINSIHREKFNVKLLQGQQEVWYKSSIDKLKSYNSANNKFQKNVLNNSKFLIDINEAYSYPLNIDSHPVCPFDLENEINEEMSSFSSRSTFPLSSSSTYPLSAPLPAHIEANFEKQEGTEELTKAIILHLLKSGYSDVVPLLVNQVSPLLSTTYRIDFELSQQFTLLHEILDDICLRHDLRQALGWFYTKYNENMEKTPSFVDSVDAETFSSTEFKFHMLQFILLLNGKQLEFSSHDAIEAYIYSKEHLERFLKKYLHEMAPLLTLMLFNEDDDSGIENFSKLRNKGLAARDFIEKMRIGFLIDKGSHRGNANTSQLEFVSLLLDCFTNVHEHQSLFTKLANDFVSVYCKSLKLSSDSPLFQSILAGHVYLPSFYKYNRIHSRLKGQKLLTAHDEEGVLETELGSALGSGFTSGFGSASDLSKNKLKGSSNGTGYNFELPFQLLDRNRFLFINHPIFVCPVSREQAIPVTYELVTSTRIEKLPGLQLTVTKEHHFRDCSSTTQVVALNFCNHLALRESIWQLSKKGIDIFKCPYCSKKHKYTDVSDAFFIDL